LLRLRDEGLPLPAGAVALSPVTDLTFSGESIQRNDGVDDMFSADGMDGLVPVYLADRALRTHPHVSPVFGDFAGLPPLLVIVGSTELLLDDSVRVAQRWPQATLLVWDGMPHVFVGFDFLPEAREATQRIGRFVRERLALEAEPAAVAKDEADVAPGREAAFAEGGEPHPPRRLGVMARRYLAIAVISGSMWLAVILWGMGPLLLLAHPVVWVAALSLGAIWAVAALLFLRASFGARIGPRKPRS